ncbi:MAG: hypothetical protein GKC04_01385 [Methanomicrobiales archaeon]|nr:hypothetical protein [Methanomicrobiales archaeon]
MGIDSIIERINTHARAEIEHIDADAERQADAIIAAARSEADAAYARILADGRRERRMSVRRILAQASMDARTISREEREKAISLCFAEAEKALTYLAGTGAYRAVVRRLIEGGIEELDSSEVILTCTERDRELIAGICREIGNKNHSLSLQPECAIATGGVILRTKNGKISVNNTFEARMERLRDGLLFGIVGILFRK